MSAITSDIASGCLERRTDGLPKGSGLDMSAHFKSLFEGDEELLNIAPVLEIFECITNPAEILLFLWLQRKSFTNAVNAFLNFATRIQFQRQGPEEVDRVDEKVRYNRYPVQLASKVETFDGEDSAGAFRIGDVAEK